MYRTSPKPRKCSTQLYMYRVVRIPLLPIYSHKFTQKENNNGNPCTQPPLGLRRPQSARHLPNLHRLVQPLSIHRNDCLVLSRAVPTGRSRESRHWSCDVPSPQQGTMSASPSSPIQRTTKPSVWKDGKGDMGQGLRLESVTCAEGFRADDKVR